MSNDTHLDQKYFIDESIYNCPFCNRRHVSYANLGSASFNWNQDKKCNIWRVQCQSCNKVSMHLTYEELQKPNYGRGRFHSDLDLDSLFFYSIPTAHFTLDSRIPAVLRELITEAELCLKMNLLTGASACTRKAIYELTIIENAEGGDYENKIKYLKEKYPAIHSEFFDTLCHIKDMTSNKVHEQSWDKWDKQHITLFLGVLREVLHEIYVLPELKKEGFRKVQSLLGQIKQPQQANSKETQTNESEPA